MVIDNGAFFLILCFCRCCRLTQMQLMRRSRNVSDRWVLLLCDIWSVSRAMLKLNIIVQIKVESYVLTWQCENARWWCIKCISHLAVHPSPPWQKPGWCRPCPEGFWRCVESQTASLNCFAPMYGTYTHILVCLGQGCQTYGHIISCGLIQKAWKELCGLLEIVWTTHKMIITFLQHNTGNSTCMVCHYWAQLLGA